MKWKNLAIFLLAMIAVFILVANWPVQAQSPDAQSNTTNEVIRVGTDKPLSRWILQLEGDWKDVVSDPAGLTTTEGVGYIEAGTLFGRWQNKPWTRHFEGGTILTFRNESSALYVDITYNDGTTETVTLAE